MDQNGGEIAAQLAKPPDDGEDHLSALPDDALVLILLRLDTDAAARTSVLSRRWRRVWALLPELRFRFSLDPLLIRSALAGHEATLSYLFVGTYDASPDSVADWLPIAAPRLSGRLIYRNRTPGRNDGEGGEEGVFDLPCLDNATSVSLDLGFLGLAVPPAGVFARLTELSLTRVWFHGSCDLSGAVSTTRCPCLQKLSVRDTRRLLNLTIHSVSLLRVELQLLDGLRQLTIVAPELKDLRLVSCFVHGQVGTSQVVANISTPQLESLVWKDPYDPSSVQLGNLGQLQQLTAIPFWVYGRHDSANRGFLMLLGRFQVIHHLQITLVYPMYIGNLQYLMEDLNVLPRHKLLTVFLNYKGHAFGASIFHLLRLCTDVRRLTLVLRTHNDLEAQYACLSSGCVCDQPMGWKTEELTLNCLQEVVFMDMKGNDHEIAFTKRLFIWAMVLKKMSITFDLSISESKARELHQILSSFSRPETYLECYMYSSDKKRQCLLPPEDQGTGV